MWLNEKAYDWRYRNLDSCSRYALRVLNNDEQVESTGDQKAEAMNTLAFVSIAQMNYSKAALQLDSVDLFTDSQIELAIADVQRMRLCQRQSHNKEFYHYRQLAKERLKRIDEDKDILSQHQTKRLRYLQSEFHIVSSTYYYYVGLEEQSRQALAHIDPYGEILQDTAQWLNYMYNIGAGGIVDKTLQNDVEQEEFDCLMRCFLVARGGGYKFWIANSMQSFSEHLIDRQEREKLTQHNLPAMKFLNTDNMPDSLIAGNLAQRSLELFIEYGDKYQVSGAYRTLAQCYWTIGDNNSALLCLSKAINGNKNIGQAPDLVASIHEQLSVVYASMSNKQKSDYHRNVYLDMQERTRQDKFLESRIDELTSTVRMQNIMILLVAMAIAVVVLLLVFFNYLRSKKSANKRVYRKLLQPLSDWKQSYVEAMAEQKENLEEIEENLAVARTKIVDNKIRLNEQKAKLALVENLQPLIERMLHEIRTIGKQSHLASPQILEKRDYILEIVDYIKNSNEVLTQWIKIEKGDLNIRIESFSLHTLFTIVARSNASFKLKGIDLEVKPTDDCVKADKTLTLFMINTLADNARQHTAEGGKIIVSSQSFDEYVEVSISDTGEGLTQSEIEEIFSLDRKIKGGHGFGLLNCRGIIEKYRKLSPLFSVAYIGVESKKNVGSRFFFRLPHAKKRLLAMLFAVGVSLWGNAQAAGLSSANRAAAFADSVYFSNVAANYQQALVYADSACHYINKTLHEQYPHRIDTMTVFSQLKGVIPEIGWFKDSISVDYDVVLDIRNEVSVACLALHKWKLYEFNNKAYTQLYKEVSADKTLANYVSVMQRSSTNKNISIAVLIILLLSIIPLYYLLYYRFIIYNRYSIDNVKNINDILLSESDNSLKLEAIVSLPSVNLSKHLSSIVEQIKTNLSEAIKESESISAETSFKRDQLQQAEYEKGKLHVANNLLSNSLSTLKHETMYYPSRIRQLMISDSIDVKSVEEVMAYYKMLYSLLCRQASSSFVSIKPKCRKFPLSEVVDLKTMDIHFDECLQPISMYQCWLYGDSDLLAHCFQTICRQSTSMPVKVNVSKLESNYLRFSFLINTITKPNDVTDKLFSATSTDNIPYLVCRQILRDIGESTRHRRCGISARLNDDSQLELEIDLWYGN